MAERPGTTRTGTARKAGSASSASKIAAAMAKMPGSPPDTTATRRPFERQREGMPRPVALDAIVRRVAREARPLRHARHIGDVAHEVGRRPRGPRSASGVSQAAGPGPSPTIAISPVTADAPGPAPARWRSRAPRRRASRQRHDDLGRHRAALDVDRTLQKPRRREGRAHLGKVSAELHDDRRIGSGEARPQGRLVERPGQDRQDVVAPGHGFAGRRPAARHARDARHHRAGEAVPQANVEMHEGAVEERVSLAEQRHVATRGQSLAEDFGRLGIEGGELGPVAGIVERDLGRDGVVQRQFLAARRDPAVRDGPGHAATPLLGESS